MIEVSGLRISYGDYEAVRGLDLAIERGGLFGLLGPNGAGKTTTLKGLVGLVRADSGRIRVDGLDPWSRRREVRRRVGVVPQRLALFPALSVIENLRIFGGLYGLRGRDLRNRVTWGLALARLEERADTEVSALSGGMARRLNLAAALLHDPQLIICDEPTTGVDPQSRQHIFETLKHLHATGRTIVYTTHYMEEVEALCTHVAIVDHGRVVAQDTLESLVRGAGATGFDITTREDAELDADDVRDALRAAGHPVQRVTSIPRSLEDVFLDLTGRTLRDGE